MPKRSLTLREAVEVLKDHYGPPTPLPTVDPFELILWENVAYLAPPARRRQAFELLRRTVGTAPAVILTAKHATLERVTAQGILKSTFGAKLRECASIAVNEFGGDLGAAIQGPVDMAKRALRSFPGIGETGAEKILLFTGQQALVAPDSNGLRVLVRSVLFGTRSRTHGHMPPAAKSERIYLRSRASCRSLTCFSSNTARRYAGAALRVAGNARWRLGVPMRA